MRTQLGYLKPKLELVGAYLMERAVEDERAGNGGSLRGAAWNLSEVRRYITDLQGNLKSVTEPVAGAR